jgi:uncharacterized membrane protein YphA (DoxX/SURF4 family)
MVGIDSGVGELLFLVGRAVFGLVLAYMSVGHFTNTGYMAGYAESKGVPAPALAVVASGVTLALGGLGIALGAFPVLAAGALAVFFLLTAVSMHDFWAAEGEERQNELIQFQKNAALFGASLAFLALGGSAWPYALNAGLF